jgi:hypothetical protein
MRSVRSYERAVPHRENSQRKLCAPVAAPMVHDNVVVIMGILEADRLGKPVTPKRISKHGVF